VDPFVIISFNQNVEFVILVVDPTQVEAILPYNKEKTKCIRRPSFPRLMGCKATFDKIYYGC
jgi:hypothetical protein